MVDHAVELEIALPCAPEAAYWAWTAPEEVTAWWGEAGVYRTTGWSADLRTGGGWRADFAGDDGQPFSAEGRYLTLVGTNRLFHLPQDRWPHAVDVATIAGVASAAARIVIALERNPISWDRISLPTC